MFLLTAYSITELPLNLFNIFLKLNQSLVQSNQYKKKLKKKSGSILPHLQSWKDFSYLKFLLDIFTLIDSFQA